jgi:hypothetical protein
MKKLCLLWLVSLGSWFPANAQEFEIEQLLLNVEKLVQFKQILKDMQDGYEILVKGYGVIKDLSEGNFNLHQVFLDGLLEVSPTVKKYKRIAEIVDMQVQLAKLSKSAARQFQISQLFNDRDMRYVQSVYDRLFTSSLRNMEDLSMVITAGKLRMSDNERLEAIDRIYSEVSDKLVFVRSFNEGNKILLLQKARESKDVNVLRGLLEVKE